MRRSALPLRPGVSRPLVGAVVLACVLLVGVVAPASAGSVLDAINSARGDHGLPRLAPFGDDTAARTANDSFLSSGQEHGTAGDAAPWYFDRGATGFRENQAILPDAMASPASVVQVWLTSEAHAANLLAPEATHVAAASRSSGGRTYFTVHVLAGGSTAAPPPPDPGPAPAPAPRPGHESEPAPEPSAPDPSSAEGSATGEDGVTATMDAGVERDLSALRAPVPPETGGGGERSDDEAAGDHETADPGSQTRGENVGGQAPARDAQVLGRIYEESAGVVASAGEATVPLLGLAPAAFVLVSAGASFAVRRRRRVGGAGPTGQDR